MSSVAILGNAKEARIGRNSCTWNLSYATVEVGEKARASDQRQLRKIYRTCHGFRDTKLPRRRARRNNSLPAVRRSQRPTKLDDPVRHDSTLVPLRRMKSCQLTSTIGFVAAGSRLPPQAVNSSHANVILGPHCTGVQFLQSRPKPSHIQYCNSRFKYW